MSKIKLIFLQICLIVICQQVIGQVMINEYSASNLNSFYDRFGKTEDWIELYNAGTEDIDISGFHLSDKLNKPGKWEIPDRTIIRANGYLIFSCSGRDATYDGEVHTNFKLTQTKDDEYVVLSDQQENIINAFQLEITQVEQSRCRVNDGSEQWAICTSPSYGTSNDATMASQFSSFTATPSMDLNAGFYSGSQVVTVTNNEPNSIIRFTLDGTNPTHNSPTYTEPISITETTVIKAQAFSLDDTVLPGNMDFNTYLINESSTLAVFSVAADDVIELANGRGELIPIGSIEYFNLNKEREATSFGSLNRHGQDSWALDHRSLDWVSRDEMGYSKAVEAPLFSYSDRDSYQKFMFRNSGDDNYPAIDDFNHQGSTHIRDEYVQTLAQDGGLRLDLRAVERVVVYLNGEYWGVYGMRERAVDHDYTNEYYGQGKYDLQYLSTWGNTNIEYGGDKALSDWVNLREQILSTDMSSPINYNIVKDSIDVLSMIDYFLVNLNVVASDWLNYNTGWWRGLNPDGGHKKWGYILWDLDATFDYYINYSGVPNTNPNAKPCDLEDISDYMDEFFNFYGWTPEGDVGQHEKIILKLLEENNEFKQLYYSRYADLMNTVYSCDNMSSTLERMLAVIEPEMPAQINRWGGTMEEWQTNVDDLKSFINQRCELLAAGAIQCYDELTDTHQLTLQVTPAGIGEIDLNTLDIETFPWNGEYFEGMDNIIRANVFSEYEDDYRFSHWESSAASQISPSINAINAKIRLTSPDTLTAVYVLKEDFISSDSSPIEALEKFDLFPNPTADHFTIQFTLNEHADIYSALYNLQGQRIMTFPKLEGRQATGTHSVILSIRNQVPAGLYLLDVEVNGVSMQRKISIIQ